MSSRGDRTTRVVSGALRSCITDHGPISVEWVQSATKRVVGELRQTAGQILTVEGEGLLKSAFEHEYKKYEKLKHGHQRLISQHDQLRERYALAEAVLDAAEEVDAWARNVFAPGDMWDAPIECKELRDALATYRAATNAEGIGEVGE